MNTFFASAGRSLANVVDGVISASKTAIDETGDAGSSFVNGFTKQRKMNGIKQVRGKIVPIKPIRA